MPPPHWIPVPIKKQLPPPFREGEVIVKFRPDTLPVKIPTTALQIAKAFALIDLFKLLAKLDKKYGLLSVQPLVRDGHAIIDPLFLELARLLFSGQLKPFGDKLKTAVEAGKLRSFPKDREASPDSGIPTPALTAARIKQMLARLLFRFNTGDSIADLDAIVKEFQKLNLIVEYAEKVPQRFIYIPQATADPLTEPGFHGLVPLGEGDPDRPPTYTATWGRDITNWKKPRWNEKVVPKVYVAMLDTGVDFSHPRLKGSVITGFSNWSWDFEGHGTHVCGVMAASAPGSSDPDGAVIPPGVLADGYTVISYKVVAGEVWNNEFYPVDPVLYASAMDAIANLSSDFSLDAINISLGGTEPLSKTESDGLAKMASRHKCPIVAAAGNYVGTAMYPAQSSYCIAVAAATYRPGRTPPAGFWQYSAPAGADGYIAPGFNVLSAMPTYMEDRSNYKVTYQGWMAGTSMASPFIAALLAMKGRDLVRNLKFQALDEKTTKEYGVGFPKL